MDLQELINKAESGDVIAQNNLAICYEEGKCIERNLSAAFCLYKKVAEKGYDSAQYNLALCYEFGRGTEINLSEAIKWYEKAAEQGNVDAQYNLAICFKEGRGTDANLHKAIEWYQKAAVQDYCAMNNLAVCYEEEGNLKEAFKLYETSAKQGNVDAQFNLALCYEEGKGTDIDLKEAIKWYKKAAEQGYCEAQFNLAVCYEEGKGTEIDINETIKWYEKAAIQGDTDAQFNLCSLYFNKDNMKSILKGLCWLVKAAKQGMEEARNLLEIFTMEIIKLAEKGDAEAQFLLGRSFQNGDGVEMNQNEALKWCRLSAEQDYDKTQNNLEYLYLECNNYKEAINWFERAAKQNCALAQLNLSTLYNDVNTIEIDVPKAVHWLKKAAEHGMKEANEILDEIHEELKS